MRAKQLGRLLERLTRTSRAELSLAEMQLAAIRGQQLDAGQQVASHYERMARMWLRGSSKIGGFNTLQKSLNRLKQDIKIHSETLTRRQEELQQQYIKLDELRVQAKELSAQRENQLQTDSEALAAHNALLKSQEKLARFTAEHTETLAEITLKRQEYENQPVFTFLLNKQYGTPRYSAWILVRKLDKWLANISHFEKNYANYQALDALRKASVKRQQDKQYKTKNLEEAFQKYVNRVDKRLNMEALPEEIASLELLMNNTKEHVAQLRNQIQQYARNEDEEIKSIKKQLAEQMNKLPIADLEDVIFEDDITQEDPLLQTLSELQMAEQKLNEDVPDKQKIIDAASAKVAAAQALESRYYAQYHDANAEFAWGLFDEPEEYFVSYLSGQVGLADVEAKLASVRHMHPTETEEEEDHFIFGQHRSVLSKDSGDSATSERI